MKKKHSLPWLCRLLLVGRCETDLAPLMLVTENEAELRRRAAAASASTLEPWRDSKWRLELRDLKEKKKYV